MHCSPLIKSVLIALFLQPAMNAVSAPPTASNGPTVVVHYNVKVKPMEPDKPTVVGQATVWITAQGTREEEINGSVTIAVKGQPFIYLLRPVTKQSVRRKPSAEGPDFLSDKFVFSKLPSDFTAKTRKIVFLGLPCVATQFSVPTAGQQAQGEQYVTQIAGRSVVLLRDLRFSTGGFIRTEATKVEVCAEAPPGLLDIPADYQVTTEKPGVATIAP